MMFFCALIIYLLGTVNMMALCEQVFESRRPVVLMVATLICCALWPVITLYALVVWTYEHINQSVIKALKAAKDGVKKR
jgi:hypothetical protein